MGQIVGIKINESKTENYADIARTPETNYTIVEEPADRDVTETVIRHHWHLYCNWSSSKSSLLFVTIGRLSLF